MKKRKIFKVPFSGVFFQIVALLVIFISYNQTLAQGGTTPLQGVWSVEKIVAANGTTSDPAQPGMFIFTPTHYSAVYTTGSEPRPPSKTAFSPTPEEMAAQYASLIVNTGTYEVEGSTVIMKPLLAKSPEFIGGSATMQFNVSGNHLTLTTSSIVTAEGSSPSGGGGGIMTLRRLKE